MPIYEYECIKCGERFELRRGITDSDSEIRCSKCGAENPRRVFSGSPRDLPVILAPRAALLEACKLVRQFASNKIV